MASVVYTPETEARDILLQFLAAGAAEAINGYGRGSRVARAAEALYDRIVVALNGEAR